MCEIKIIVMSLPNSRRKPKIKKQLEDGGFSFEFSDGISKNDLTIDFKQLLVKDPKYTISFIDNPAPLHPDYRFFESFGNRGWVKIGEIGTFFAHFNVWKKLLEDDSADAYMILEDDALFLFNLDDFNRFKSTHDLSGIDMVHCQKVSPNFQNGKIGFENLPDHLTPVKIDQHVWQNTEGLATYIVTKEGARKIIEFWERFGFFTPVDNEVTRIFMVNYINMFYAPNYLLASLNDEADYSEVHHVDIVGELKDLGKLGTVTFKG